MLSKVWFEDATAAATERETTYPHLAPSETLPVIIDIHDISRPGLCRELSPRDRGTLTRKQNRFARQLEYDLEDDIDDFENDAVLKQYRPSGKLVTRICKLCPVGYSPLVCPYLLLSSRANTAWFCVAHGGRRTSASS